MITSSFHAELLGGAAGGGTAVHVRHKNAEQRRGRRCRLIIKEKCKQPSHVPWLRNKKVATFLSPCEIRQRYGRLLLLFFFYFGLSLPRCDELFTTEIQVLHAFVIVP